MTNDQFPDLRPDGLHQAERSERSPAGTGDQTPAAASFR